MTEKLDSYQQQISVLSDFLVEPCRCGWPVLVCEQCWAGVFRRWDPWGFLSGAPGARSPRHPWQERQIPAWRPGRHTEGRWTHSEQLSPVGVLIRSNISHKQGCDTHLWVNFVAFNGKRQLLKSKTLYPVLVSSLLGNYFESELLISSHQKNLNHFKTTCCFCRTWVLSKTKLD